MRYTSEYINDAFEELLRRFTDEALDFFVNLGDENITFQEMQEAWYIIFPGTSMYLSGHLPINDRNNN